MELRDKIVDFNTYCAICSRKDKLGYDEPCNSCLTMPVRENTRVPLKFDLAAGAKDPRYKRGGKNDPGYKKGV